MINKNIIRFYRVLWLLLVMASSSVRANNCRVGEEDYSKKISKLFIVTYSKQDWFANYMSSNGYSGMIGFSHDLSSHKNYQSLQQELAKLRTFSDFTPLLTIDHEGGLVQRLKKFEEITYIPSAKVLGEHLDSLPEEQALLSAQEVGRIMGQDLAAVGFNWNFAPVFDVDYDLPDNPISKYHRAFSNIPIRAGKYASAVSLGMSKHVITTAKHFPGQGITKIDSHKGSCKKNNSCPDFKMQDLEPFKMGVASGAIDTVMIGHVYFPNLDDQLATYSSKIIKDILGSQLGFKGVVVSDDFTMGALGEALGVSAKKFRKGNDRASLGLALEKAIKSGIHLIVLSEFVDGRREEFATKHLCSKIKTDQLLRDSVDQAIVRIDHLKEKAATLKYSNLSEKTRKNSYQYIRQILKSVIKQKGRSWLKKYDKKSLSRYKL